MKHTYYTDDPQHFCWVPTDGGVKVTGYLGAKDYICIPETIDGKPVVAVGKDPRKMFGRKYHALIPSTVKHIDWDAFPSIGCSSSLWMLSLELEQDHPYWKIEGQLMLSRDGKTLVHCLDLQCSELTIPEGIETIGTGAFYGTNVSAIRFPGTLKILEDGAFAESRIAAYSYSPLKLPEGLEKIGLNLFESRGPAWSKSVHSIEVPASVREIGAGEGLYLHNLENNPNFCMKWNFLLSHDGKILYFCAADQNCTEVAIPYGVEEIRPYALANCSEMKKLEFPETLRKICHHAFGENKVKTLRIPASVQIIEEDAYPYGSLTSILLDKKNPWFYSDKTCLYRLLEEGQKELVCCFRPKLEEYTVEEGTARFAPKAFAHCQELRFLTLPESLECLDEDSLGGNIRQLVIPKGLRQIRRGQYPRFDLDYVIEDNPYFFWDQDVLYHQSEDGLTALRGRNDKPENIVLKDGCVRVAPQAFGKGACTLTCPPSLRIIEHDAFYMTDLQKITLNEGLQYIEDKAFARTKLKKVTIPSTMVYMAPTAFEDTPLESYAVAPGNDHYAHREDALYSSDMTILYDVPFKKSCNCFVVPDGVMEINKAFQNCTGIKTIVLPDGLKHLWAWVFVGCKKLKELHVGSGLEYASTDCIEYDASVSIFTEEGATMDSLIREIWNQAPFMNLHPVYKGKEELLELCKDFYLIPNAQGLTVSKYVGKDPVVTIPQTVGSYTVNAIGPKAFAPGKEKSVLEEIILPDTVTEIGKGAFYECNVTKLTLGNGLRKLGPAAFSKCSKLQELVLPEGIEEIPEGTFYGCGKLSNVVVPSTVTAISAGLFTSKEDYPGLSGNFDCNFIVESGSCAETALKAFSVKDWNKTYTLKVITAGENECKFSETDQRYLRYLDYEELEDGTLSVRNKHPFPEDVTVLEIPDELLGKRVSSYTKGQYVIPNQITRIIIGAGITHLDLPVPSSYNGQNEALTGIDVSAENPNYWSDGLAVYSKDRSCFVRMVSTQAESYVLHPDTRILSEHAFANLQKLTHLTLNDGLQIIEDNSLGMSMETIDGIEKVPQVSLNGLWRTSWFENQKLLYLGGTLLKCKLTDQKVFTVREGTTCIRENAFSRDLQWGKPNLDALEEIIIPDSVTEIQYNAFYTRFNVKKIHLPNGLRKLEKGVLHSLVNLESVHIPAAVEEISMDAFPSRDFNAKIKLREITVDEQNPFYKSVDGIVYSRDGGTLVKYPPARSAEVFQVPEGVHTIAPYAFVNSEFLRKVILPDHVHTIGESAFDGCEALAEAAIHGVRILKGRAFMGCRALTSVILPGTLHTIEEKAFAQVNLAHVEIPPSVSFVGESAFSHTQQAKVYDSLRTSCVSKMFERDRALGGGWQNHTVIVCSAQTGEVKYVVPEFAADNDYDYQSALERGWRGGQYDFVILDEAFADIKGQSNKIKLAVNRLQQPIDLTQQARETYEAYLKRSAKDLVKGCIDADDMQTLVFCAPLGILKKNNIEELLEHAAKSGKVEFSAYLMSYKEENLTSRKGGGMPDFSFRMEEPWAAPKNGTSKVGRYKGSDCVVEFPLEVKGKRITGIADSTSKVPENYGLITELIIPEGYLSIGAYAFHGCSNLTKVTLPSTLQEIDRYAFAGCSSLQEIVIPDSVDTLGESAFAGCDQLANVTLSKSLRRIPADAFRGCNAMTQLELPESVCYLGEDAFASTPNLNRVIVRSMMLQGDQMAFWNTPQIYAYPGATIKVPGIRKKNIQYMIEDGQVIKKLNPEVKYSQVDTLEFEKKIFVLSGFGADEESKITQIILDKGGEVKSSVVVKTDYLILNENYGGITTKYTRSLELNQKGKNIQILSAARFYELAE